MNCIEYTGYRDAFGYGQSGRGYAHRWAWEQAHGPIPDGLCVLHSCDNPSCINIEHLRLGTHTDNMRDLVERGRASRGVLHPAAKLTNEERREIRERHLNGERVCTIAPDYAVARSLVSMIANGKRWSP